MESKRHDTITVMTLRGILEELLEYAKLGAVHMDGDLEYGDGDFFRWYHFEEGNEFAYSILRPYVEYLYDDDNSRIKRIGYSYCTQCLLSAIHLMAENIRNLRDPLAVEDSLKEWLELDEYHLTLTPINLSYSRGQEETN